MRGAGRLLCFVGEKIYFFSVLNVTIIFAFRDAWCAGFQPAIKIYDTTCSCFSPSGKIFDCKSLLRKIAQAYNPKIKKQKSNSAVHGNTVGTVIKQYLDSLGYFQTQSDTSPEGVITVLVGKRTVVCGERIISVRPPPPDSLESFFGFTYPRLFNASEVRERTGEIGRIYTGNGYPFVSITTDIVALKEKDTVELVYYVDPDEYCTFSFPHLSGRFSTKRDIILRDIAIKTNTPFDRRAIDLTLERLRSRSYISEAAALPPLIAPNSDTLPEPEHKIIVPFVVNDRSGLGLDGAAGMEAGTGERARFFGNVLFSFVNLFRRAEEAHFSYSGDRFRQKLDLSYTQPWLPGAPVAASVGGGLEVISETYGYMFGNIGLFYEPAVRWYTGIKMVGNSVSKNINAEGENGFFAGADIVLDYTPEPYRDGVWGRELSISAGSGIARKSRMHNRSHIDFIAGGHLPLPFHTAFLLRIRSGHIITRENDLVASEKYRVGGGGSLRGYIEDEFAFKTVVYGQSEYLYYFQNKTPIYLFLDGGIGFENEIGGKEFYRKMVGYGIGIRIPAPVGIFSIEWARNIGDTKSPGRIHAGFRNTFSLASESRFSSMRK